jgi:hypothetical protein
VCACVCVYTYTCTNVCTLHTYKTRVSEPPQLAAPSAALSPPAVTLKVRFLCTPPRSFHPPHTHNLATGPSTCTCTCPRNPQKMFTPESRAITPLPPLPHQRTDGNLKNTNSHIKILARVETQGGSCVSVFPRGKTVPEGPRRFTSRVRFTKRPEEKRKVAAIYTGQGKCTRKHGNLCKLDYEPKP